LLQASLPHLKDQVRTFFEIRKTSLYSGIFLSLESTLAHPNL